ncbi:MAG: DUF805 domain-containing protein [Galbitalea sp.]
MSIPPPPPLSFPSEPPLGAPYYGASIGVAFTRYWKKYATFTGRASRSEYWWWALIYFIVAVVLEVVLVSVTASTAVVSDDGTVALGPAYFVVIALVWIISLGTLVPSLAIVWRRLHDTNRSGGYYFLSFIPLVGGIIVLVFLASSSNPAGARFDQPQS